MTRTPHTAEFKKKVALEALREDKTLGQIASAHGVHPVQVSKWKKMLLDGAASVFADFASFTFIHGCRAFFLLVKGLSDWDFVWKQQRRCRFGE